VYFLKKLKKEGEEQGDGAPSLFSNKDEDEKEVGVGSCVDETASFSANFFCL
jgi:hypothetical protein